MAKGFVYTVSIAGITGSQQAKSEHVAEMINRIRQATDIPALVGFGIRTPEDAEMMANVAASSRGASVPWSRNRSAKLQIVTYQDAAVRVLLRGWHHRAV